MARGGIVRGGIVRGVDSAVRQIKFLQLNLQHSKMAQINISNWIDKTKVTPTYAYAKNPMYTKTTH